LTDVLRNAGPFEVIRLLGAFQNSTEEPLGLKLIEALAQSKSASMLRTEILKPKIAKFPPPVQEKADKLLASINTDSSAQRQHLEELLPQLAGGGRAPGPIDFQ